MVALQPIRAGKRSASKPAVTPQPTPKYQDDYARETVARVQSGELPASKAALDFRMRSGQGLTNYGAMDILQRHGLPHDTSRSTHFQTGHSSHRG